MASALVQNQMCTCPRLIKLICAIIICSPIGRVSSDSHLSDKAKIAFRTIGRPFRLPLYLFVVSCCVYMIFTFPQNNSAHKGLNNSRGRAGASTTRVLVLSKMVNMNILKTLYSSTTRVLIFQYSYSYSYVKYSPQPCPGVLLTYTV